jgi:hypothetical protein
MELAGGHGVVAPKSSVAMHPQGLIVVATVGVTAAAGVTALAIQIGLHAATIPGAYRRDALADRHHFDPQFVARDSRVGEKRHLAQIPPQVGAANAHLMDAHHRLTRAGCGRFVDVEDPERSGLFQLNGLHAQGFGIWIAD